MSDVTKQEPLIERFKLGIIDEYGKLRVLIGKHFLTINCLRYLEGVKGQSECRFNCSHFSGPQPKELIVTTDDKDTQVPYQKILLLCSGRTLYFEKFINVLEWHKPDQPLDFDKMSEEDIVNALGLVERQIPEDQE